MALFAIIQHFTSNGHLLWFYQHPHRQIGESVQGAFANKNHFGHFVTMGLAPLIGLAVLAQLRRREAFRLSRDWRLLLPAGGALLVAATVLLSLSRGAAAAMSVCLLVAGGLFYCARVASLRKLLVAAAASSLLVIAALSLHGYQGVSQRLGDFASGQIDRLDRSHGRRWIWEANLAAQAQSPLVGYGVGSHREVYRAFFEHPFTTEFTHCESAYLHLRTEGGGAAVVLAAAAISLLLTWCIQGWRRARTREQHVTWAMIAPGIVASLVHALIDFVWFIPACFAMTVLLAATAMRLYQLQDEIGASQESPQVSVATYLGEWSLLLRWAPISAACLAGVLMWRPGLAALAWDAYLRDSVAIRHFTNPKAELANVNVVQSRRFFRDRAITSLEQAIARAPGHHRAHQRLASRLIERFEDRVAKSGNAMTLQQINQAALAARFPTRQETVAWLRDAFSTDADDLLRAHRHTLLALQACPCQGVAYSLLVELSCLSPPSLRDARALDNQALTLSPTSGTVLFNAGRRRLLAGDSESFKDLWHRALQQPGTHQDAMIALLSRHATATELLDTFQPEWRILWRVLAAYAEQGTMADHNALADYALEATHREADKETAERAAAYWIATAKAQARARRTDDTLRSARNAVNLTPNGYSARRTLAWAAMNEQKWQEADTHLRWCLSRRPDDANLRATLKHAAKQRHVTSQLGHLQTRNR